MLKKFLSLFFKERPLVYFGKEVNDKATYIALSLFPNEKVSKKFYELKK